MLIIDGHCDTVQVALDKNVDLENESLSFNLKRAIEKAPILQMMAAFIKCVGHDTYLTSESLVAGSYRQA